MDLNKAPSPNGSPFRNLRPEMAAGNNEHRAFKIDLKQYDRIRTMLGSLDALHRLAFITAAAETDGLFIDIRQRQEPVPFPEHGELFCAIIGDREITETGAGRRNLAQATRITDTNAISNGRGGFLAVPAGTRIVSRGPSWYHQTSMRKLLRQARHVMIDSSGVGLAAIYASACAPLVEQNKSAILVETSDDILPEWIHFVNENTTDCQYRLVSMKDVVGNLQAH